MHEVTAAAALTTEELLYLQLQSGLFRILRAKY